MIRHPDTYVTRADLARAAHRSVQTIRRWENEWGLIKGTKVPHHKGGPGKHMAYEPWVIERVREIDRLVRLNYSMEEIVVHLCDEEAKLNMAMKRMEIVSTSIDDHFKELKAQLESINAMLARVRRFLVK